LRARVLARSHGLRVFHARGAFGCDGMRCDETRPWMNVWMKMWRDLGFCGGGIDAYKRVHRCMVFSV
jgi:hypothetical protein